MSKIEELRAVLERYGYGVCEYIGLKIGIPTVVVQRYFIYSSFITIGSPIIFYLFIAFWVKIRDHIRDAKSYLID